MDNLEYLRNKLKPYIRDITIPNDVINDIIVTTLDEIATETRIFKKLYGFTVHKEKEMYNFKQIAMLNERVELEPTSISIGMPSNEEIALAISLGQDFIDPVVDKQLIVETARSILISVVDIFDNEGFSVSYWFKENGTSHYMCYDKMWREDNDGKAFAFLGTVIPDIQEYGTEDFKLIYKALIAGIKFYAYDMMHSGQDAQTANYDFMRWHQAKQDIMNMYPQYSISYKEQRKWLY